MIVKTIDVPSGLTAPQLVSQSQYSITVSWVAPTNTGSSAVKYYILYMKPEYSSTYVQVYVGLSKFYTATISDPGFAYLFEVQAVNEAGASDLSSPSAPIYAAVVPDPPVQIQLVSRSQTQIKISWSQPIDNGGMPITGYKVYVATDSGLYIEDTSAPSKTDPAIKYYQNTAVTAGVLYGFKVTAVNYMGESLYSDQILIVAANLPSKPSAAPAISSVGMTSATITMTAVSTSSNGGASVTGYILMIDNGLGDDGSYVVKSDSLTLTISIGNLISGRTYRVKYAARNIVYDSNNLFGADSLQFSLSSSFTTAVNPEPPVNLAQSVYRFRTSVLVQWDPPISSGGSPLTSFDIKIDDVTTSTSTVLSISPALSSYHFTNLTPGSEYDISIRSKTAFGTSDYTDSIVTYPGVIPTSPAPVTFTSTTRNSIVVQWTSLLNEDTGGTTASPIAISSYNLYIKEASVSSDVNSTDTAYTLVCSG